LLHCFNEQGRKRAFKDWKKELKNGVNHMRKSPFRFNGLFQYDRLNVNKLHYSPL
jgi:hypothetical protein